MKARQFAAMVFILIASGHASGCGAQSSGDINKKLAGIESQLTRVESRLSHSDPLGDGNADRLVAEAESAFQADKERLAIALLASALVIRPNNAKAIDAYRNRLRSRFQAALKEHDWDTAETEIAAYDSTVRSALRGAVTKPAVEAIVGRQDEVSRWEQELIQARDQFLKAEISAIEGQLDGADAETLSALDVRVRQLPTDGLTDESVERVANLALKLVRLEQEGRLRTLEEDLDKTSGSAIKPKVDPAALRELRIHAEHLNARIAEARLQGAEATQMQSACQELLSQIDQRLQVNSIRQLQTIADADAKKAIDDSRVILSDLKKNGASKTYQWCGGKLAEAEVYLNKIDRLCSVAIQTETHDLLESIRRDAIAFRAQQARAYNLWAIGVLEESVSDYKKAKGWFNDDEEAFMKTMREKVGQIDPQHLHPITYSLFAELFQKFLGELEPSQKVTVTRAVESAERRPLSDF